MRCELAPYSGSHTSQFILYRQLLLEVRRELQDLQNDVSDIKGLLVHLPTDEHLPEDLFRTGLNPTFLEIPKEVSSKFLESTHVNTPENFQHLSDMPLKEGFDALVYHFSHVSDFLLKKQHKLTYTYRAQWGSMPTKENLGRPNSSISLRAHGLWTNWRRVPNYVLLGLLPYGPVLCTSSRRSANTDINQDSETDRFDIKDIFKEYRRFDSNQLVTPNKDVITRLPKECFSVWVVEASLLLFRPKHRPLEDLILEL